MTQSNTSRNCENPEPKMTRYSFSRISVYKQCPFRYKLEYILKVPKADEDNSALIKGSKIHSLLENIETFEYNQDTEYHDIVKKFQDSKLGQDILNKPSVRETTIRLNSELKGGDWNSDETRLIGYIDRVNLSDSSVELIDYKTGKYKDPIYQDFSQLIIYAIYMFDKYPINEINLRFVYVEHLQENSLILKRESIEKFREALKNDILKIESDKDFQKCPNRLCKWCPYFEVCNSSDSIF